jgi:phosphatidylglycerophosphatase C
MSRSLALFDFDGTITSKDTLLEFIIYSKGWVKFIFGMIALSPVLVSFLFRFMPNGRAKELLLIHFFKGETLKEFQSTCDLFSVDIIPRMLRPDALKKITEHIQRGDRIVIVSASPENWVGRWAQAHGLEWIATRLESKDGLLTGRILGKNCHGEEKVARIKDYLDISEYNSIYTYGDSRGDLPMLQLGTSVNYGKFEEADAANH